MDKKDLSTLLNKIKHTAYSSLEFQVCYFFAQNCDFCLIRGPPVLFERKKSNKNGGKNLNINDVYSLKHIKLEDGSLCFFVSFTDGKGDLIETEISEEIYNHFLSFTERMRLKVVRIDDTWKNLNRQSFH